MTIYLIGDSTLQYNDESTYPQVGWGQYFATFIKDNIKVINLGKNGASTKTFIKGENYKTLINNIKEGDLLLIQFGHNDGGSNPICITSPYKDYTENLLHLINVARRVKATPILLSSICRRKFVNYKIVDTHNDYPKAMEKLANKENVLYIDMNKLTMEKLQEVGEEESKKYYMVFDKDIYKNYPNGLDDNTHLREEGAIVISKIIINQIEKLGIILSKEN